MDHFDLLRAETCQSLGGYMPQPLVVFVSDSLSFVRQVARRGSSEGLVTRYASNKEELLVVVRELAEGLEEGLTETVFVLPAAAFDGQPGADLYLNLKSMGWRGKCAVVLQPGDQNRNDYVAKTGVDTSAFFTAPIDSRSTSFWILLRKLSGVGEERYR